ncbi:MAG: ATP-binding protein [bacterium]|nr:ATP-binding protein [bacterium]
MSFTLQPACGSNFVNREEIINEMIETLTHENLLMGFAFVGSRRVGKTSLLREVHYQLKAKDKIIPVYFSLWGLIEGTLDEFCRKLTLSIMEAYKQELSLKYRLKDLVKVPASKMLDFLKTIDVKIKILEEIEFAISSKRLENKKDISETVEDVFLLGERLATETKSRCILLLDEFPSITELKVKNGKAIGEGIIRKIRTIHESYTKTVCCISGSIKKTMNTTLLSSASPFYRQFIVKKISPFKFEDTRLLLERNLGFKLREDVISLIYNTTAGIPFYVQFIGRGLLKQKEQLITPEVISQIFNELLREEANLLFKEEFYSLGTKEREVLFYMAKESVNKPSEISRVTQESLNVISRYLDYLINKGIIRREERGVYKFEDPIFEQWIAEVLYDGQ